MYQLDTSAIVQWTAISDLQAPASFDGSCPHCKRHSVNFTVEDYVADTPTQTVSATARCTACREPSFIWYLEPSRALYMRPAPPIPRSPIEGADLMPDAVRRAYQNTIDVFNAEVWSATATATRRTLEGIVNNLMPNERGPLAEQLAKLGDAVELERPLITLSHALRQGGNIGAHFDLTRTPDRVTAEAMLDLIEYLIEYIYTLPLRIQELDVTIQRLGNEEEEQQEG